MIQATIMVHQPEIKAVIRDNDWFFTFEIGGIKFFLDSEQELVNFKNAIINGYDEFKKEKHDTVSS
jgi:hypothetical protein